MARRMGLAVVLLLSYALLLCATSPTLGALPVKKDEPLSASSSTKLLSSLHAITASAAPQLDNDGESASIVTSLRPVPYLFHHPDPARVFDPPGGLPVPNPVAPFRELICNQNGDVIWLLADVTIETVAQGGTPATDAMRRRVRELGLPNDDAGHFIANRLGGPGNLWYAVFPQTPRINRGAFRVWENQVANLVMRHRRVSYAIRAFYLDSDHPRRPSDLEVAITYVDITDTRHTVGQLFDN